jgi:hypothetical protein
MPIRSIEHTVQKLEQIMCAQLETASDYSMVSILQPVNLMGL